MSGGLKIKLWAGPHFVQRLQGRGLPASPQCWSPRKSWAHGRSTPTSTSISPPPSLAGHLSRNIGPRDYPDAFVLASLITAAKTHFQIRLHPDGKVGVNLVGAWWGWVGGMQDKGRSLVGKGVCSLPGGAVLGWAGQRVYLLLFVGQLFPPHLKPHVLWGTARRAFGLWRDRPVSPCTGPLTQPPFPCPVGR